MWEYGGPRRDSAAPGRRGAGNMLCEESPVLLTPTENQRLLDTVAILTRQLPLNITSSATFSGVQWSDRHQRGELFLRFGHLNSELIVSWVLALELERGGFRANSKSIWSPPASNMFPVPSGGGVGGCPGNRGNTVAAGVVGAAGLRHSSSILIHPRLPQLRCASS